MAYNEWSEFPRQLIRIDALTNVAKTVSTTPINISGILVTNRAANAELVLFREVDDTPEHFAINIGISATEFFPIRCHLPDLEVILDGAGDVDITIFAISNVSSTTVV